MPIKCQGFFTIQYKHEKTFFVESVILYKKCERTFCLPSGIPCCTFSCSLSMLKQLIRSQQPIIQKWKSRREQGGGAAGFGGCFVGMGGRRRKKVEYICKDAETGIKRQAEKSFVVQGGAARERINLGQTSDLGWNAADVQALPILRKREIGDSSPGGYKTWTSSLSADQVNDFFLL